MALLEAIDRAAAAGTTAHLFLTGLGLGVWKHLEGDRQDAMYYKEVALCIDRLDLRHVSTVEFGWDKIPEDEREFLRTVCRERGIKVLIGNRQNPCRKLKADELLVRVWVWDSNSLPGNEYWSGFKNTSDDPAAVCASTIAELHNPYVNPFEHRVKVLQGRNRLVDRAVDQIRGYAVQPKTPSPSRRLEKREKDSDGEETEDELFDQAEEALREDRREKRRKFNGQHALTQTGDASAEPTAETTADPAVDFPAELISETTAKPAAEPKANPITESAAEPAEEPVVPPTNLNGETSASPTADDKTQAPARPEELEPHPRKLLRMADPVAQTEINKAIDLPRHRYPQSLSFEELSSQLQWPIVFELFSLHPLRNTLELHPRVDYTPASEEGLTPERFTWRIRPRA